MTFPERMDTKKEEYIATEYIEGEHLSVSMICGQQALPLSLNKQLIDIKKENDETVFDYKGNQVPYRTDYEQEVFLVAKKTAETLKCSGYIGIDIIYGDKPYVIDVNPRPTTAIFGLVRTLKGEIAELMLMNVFGKLPDSVILEGECSFTKDDIDDIADTFHLWQKDKEKYEDIPGFCKAATVDEIKKHDYILTPGRYVGFEETEDDDEEFEEKMRKLTVELSEQFKKSEELEKKIRENLAGLGYEL